MASVADDMDMFSVISNSINLVDGDGELFNGGNGSHRPPEPSTNDRTVEDRPWGVNFSGTDFLVNYPARGDLVTAVEPLPHHPHCRICETVNPRNGVPLSTAIAPMLASRSHDAAMGFLSVVAPELATWEAINIHFNHGIADPDERLEFQLDSLIDIHYNAGVAVGREFGMMVTANGSQFIAPNEKNIKCLNSITTGLVKLTQAKFDLRKHRRQK
uniref:ORF30 n=1 Tax=Latid herpesvirus 1 TaxID=3096545 RepID=A0AB33V6K0_9VIRU